MPGPFEIRRFTLDPVTWTAVSAPFDCSNISIQNKDGSATVLMRTGRDDPDSEGTIGPLMQQSIAVPFHRYRFQAGTTAFYLRTAAGVGSVSVMFLS
jgi:hypothetical protein